MRVTQARSLRSPGAGAAFEPDPAGAQACARRRPARTCGAPGPRVGPLRGRGLRAADGHVRPGRRPRGKVWPSNDDSPPPPPCTSVGGWRGARDSSALARRRQARPSRFARLPGRLLARRLCVCACVHLGLTANLYGAGAHTKLGPPRQREPLAPPQAARTQAGQLKIIGKAEVGTHLAGRVSRSEPTRLMRPTEFARN